MPSCETGVASTLHEAAPAVSRAHHEVALAPRELHEWDVHTAPRLGWMRWVRSPAHRGLRVRRPSSGTMRGMGDESHLGLARIVAPGIHEHVAPRNPERRPFSDRRSHSQHLPAFREVDYAPILFFHL